MVLEPIKEINLTDLHVSQLDGIATEKIGEDGQIAVVGELIGKHLAVDEDTENIREDDDGLLGGLVVLRVSDVGIDYRELVTAQY